MFLRLHTFSPKIGSSIGRFYTPTVYDRVLIYFLTIPEQSPVGEENADSRVRLA